MDMTIYYEALIQARRLYGRQGLFSTSLRLEYAKLPRSQLNGYVDLAEEDACAWLIVRNPTKYKYADPVGLGPYIERRGVFSEYNDPGKSSIERHGAHVLRNMPYKWVCTFVFKHHSLATYHDFPEANCAPREFSSDYFLRQRMGHATKEKGGWRDWSTDFGNGWLDEYPSD